MRQTDSANSNIIAEGNEEFRPDIIYVLQTVDDFPCQLCEKYLQLWAKSVLFPGLCDTEEVWWVSLFEIPESCSPLWSTVFTPNSFYTRLHQYLTINGQTALSTTESFWLNQKWLHWKGPH